MKTRIWFSWRLCLLFAGALSVLFLAPSAARAQDYATDVYNRVNALRAQYGLPPYRLDPYLTAAAQAHAEWGASVGYFDHVEPDGSRPRDRAVRAGYGDYNAIRISENIYWGGMATPESAVSWWTNSAIHFQGMISSVYEDIGVGVAYGPSGGYFTLLFGVHTGNASGNSGSNTAPTQAPEADVPEIPAVQLSTPGPDGSIVHIVQEGQAIWNIATAYDGTVPELLMLNNLTEYSVIYPGDRIVVRLPNTPAPTLTPTVTPAPTRPTAVAATRTPIAVAAVYGELESAPQTAANRVAGPLQMAASTRRTVRGLLFVTLAVGIGLIMVGTISMRRHRNS